VSLSNHQTDTTLPGPRATGCEDSLRLIELLEKTRTARDWMWKREKPSDRHHTARGNFLYWSCLTFVVFFFYKNLNFQTGSV